MKDDNDRAPGHDEKRQLTLAPATPVARWAYAVAAIVLLALAAALWRAGIAQACCASWWTGINLGILLFFGGAASIVPHSTVAEAIENIAERAIGRWGQAADATITWSEQYAGDGDHPGDPCFRGIYSYHSSDGRLHHGSFRGHTYDPMDIGWAGDSIDRIRDCYTVGRRHRAIYLPRLPRAHVFQFDRAAGRLPDAPEADPA